MDASAYKLRDGMLTLPDATGFGLHVDESFYKQKVEETGWSLRHK